MDMEWITHLVLSMFDSGEEFPPLPLWGIVVVLWEFIWIFWLRLAQYVRKESQSLLLIVIELLRVRLLVGSSLLLLGVLGRISGRLTLIVAYLWHWVHLFLDWRHVAYSYIAHLCGNRGVTRVEDSEDLWIQLPQVGSSVSRLRAWDSWPKPHGWFLFILLYLIYHLWTWNELHIWCFRCLIREKSFLLYPFEGLFLFCGSPFGSSVRLAQYVRKES